MGRRMNREHRPFRRIVAVILVLATLIGFVSVFAVWAKRQLLETSTYTETSTKLLENENIRTAVAGFLVDQLGARAGVNVSGKVPPDFGQLVVIRSDQITFVQDLVNLLRKLALILPL